MNHIVTKPTKWHVRPVKTQISLGIHPVWSESSLSAWRNLGSLTTHKADSEDSDQNGRIPMLIWVFAGCTCHFVGFIRRRLKSWWLYMYMHIQCIFSVLYNCISAVHKYLIGAISLFKGIWNLWFTKEPNNASVFYESRSWNIIKIIYTHAWFLS